MANYDNVHGTEAQWLKGPVPVLDSDGICITSLKSGWIWTSIGRKLSETGDAATPEGWRRRRGPKRRGIRSRPGERPRNRRKWRWPSKATVRGSTRQPVARSSRWNKRWGNACTGVVEDPSESVESEGHSGPSDPTEGASTHASRGTGLPPTKAALESVGPEALTEILALRNCSLLTGWTTLNLAQIVLALETAAEGRAVKQ